MVTPSSCLARLARFFIRVLLSCPNWASLPLQSASLCSVYTFLLFGWRTKLSASAAASIVPSTLRMQVSFGWTCPISHAVGVLFLSFFLY